MGVLFYNLPFIDRLTMLTHHFTTSHTPSTLTALIATHHPDWQVCFLNNNHRPVIGICPKVSWTALFDDTLHIQRQTREQKTDIYPSTYADWQHELIDYANTFANSNTETGDYTHGLMGFVGYDLAAHQLNANIAIKPNQPCAYLGHYDLYLKPSNDGFVLCGVDTKRSFFDEMIHQLDVLCKKNPPNAQSAQFIAAWQKHEYINAFERTQEYIKAGDTYQINLTQQWQATLDNLSSILPSLQDTMNAPFAGYLQLNQDCPLSLSLSKGKGQKTDMVRQARHEQLFEILSVSPELFFEFYQENNNIHLMTKPIKGTRPRHDDVAIDDMLKQELATSEKDISENLMIVDLLRNDLGKYAKIGTVKTPKRFAIESFKNVHHMVSTVVAQLKEVHALEVLLGSLPAGSITGTPKKRACEIIHELEVSPRGAYCGTMGYMNFDGSGVWNVLIRTLQKSNNQAQIWAGGGITIKSDLDSEYQECFDKVGVILNFINHHA